MEQFPNDHYINTRNTKKQFYSNRNALYKKRLPNIHFACVYALKEILLHINNINTKACSTKYVLPNRVSQLVKVRPL